MNPALKSPADPTPFLVICLVGIGMLLILAVWNAMQSRALKNQMELEKERLDGIVSDAKIHSDKVSGELAQLEVALEALPKVGALVAGSDPDDRLQQLSKDLEDANRMGGELEKSHSEAVAHIRELELANSDLRETLGLSKVEPSRSAIIEAVRGAAESLEQKPGPEAKEAFKFATEDGDLILRALDGAISGDIEAAASIVEPSRFDPFVYSLELWDVTIAAKRILESARLASHVVMETYGFKLDKPRVGIDLYDSSKHDLRDSVLTNKESLKGRIAEVRRTGFLFRDQVVRPARIVQFAIDYKQVEVVSNESSIEQGAKKRGLTEF